jgi:hypothetical protein
MCMQRGIVLLVDEILVQQPFDFEIVNVRSLQELRTYFSPFIKVNQIIDVFCIFIFIALFIHIHFLLHRFMSKKSIFDNKYQ